MDLKNILNYQKKDAELIKLERALNGSENKKISQQMVAVVKEAQAQSAQLEVQAGHIIKNYEELKKSYAENIKTAGALAAKNLENLSEDDLKTIDQVAQTISSNLAILEKKLHSEAGRVRTILSNFDATKKRYNQARDKYNKHKELYEQESQKLKPEIAGKEKEVKQLESSLDSNILAKYKQKRQDGIYPVFVPCIDKACGGCRMELPSASLANLKKDGVLECEHCRRIIYSND